MKIANAPPAFRKLGISRSIKPVSNVATADVARASIILITKYCIGVGSGNTNAKTSIVVTKAKPKMKIAQVSKGVADFKTEFGIANPSIELLMIGYQCLHIPFLRPKDKVHIPARFGAMGRIGSSGAAAGGITPLANSPYGLAQLPSHSVPLSVTRPLTLVPTSVTTRSSAIIPDLTFIASLRYGERAFSGSFGVTGPSDPGTTKKPPSGGW